MKQAAIKTLMSSAVHTWTTPRWFFDRAEALFVSRYGGGFELDAAASAENRLCDRFLTEADDALGREWRGRVWLNPPYGDAIPRFLVKAHKESVLRGAKVAVLIPARTDTRAWFDVVAPYAAEIRFITGRLRFGGAESSAPFPSALVIFDRDSETKTASFWDAKERNLSLNFSRGVE